MSERKRITVELSEELAKALEFAVEEFNERNPNDPSTLEEMARAMIRGHLENRGFLRFQGYETKAVRRT